MPKKSINVLLIEDDLVDCKLAGRLLAMPSRVVQFKIDVVHILADGLKFLRNRSVDLLLLDLDLPDSVGLDTFYTIHKANPKIPIVVLTGSDDEEMGSQAIRAGAADYLIKGPALEYQLTRSIIHAIERKEVVESLKEERNEFRKYLDVAGVIMIVIDKEQKPVLINNKGCELLGYDEQEILGKDWCRNFVPEEARDEVKTALCGLLESKLEQYEYHENPIISREGKQRHIKWRNTVLHNDEGQIEAILSSGEDVTDRREAEEAAKLAYTRLEQANKELKEMHSQMVQSEKLASIGQLAAGVAHEMNTPVGFVASNFHTLESYMKKFKNLLEIYDGFIEGVERADKAELLSKIEGIRKCRDDMNIDFILEDIGGLFDDSREGMERVTNIIQNLKDFSRVDQAEDFDEYNINSGIEATLIVARNEVKYDVDVKTEFSEVPAVFCNSSQINQVFLNILLNATQAVKSQKRQEHGTITIKTYSTEEDVVCEIIDDGPGIAPDNLSKIFDPFFTTKPAGGGTGLGLSVSYDIIVSKHKGQLIADSTVGEGTKFTIKLPINGEAADNQKGAEDSEESSYISHAVKE